MLIKLLGSRNPRAGAVLGIGIMLVALLSIWLLLGDHVPAGMRSGFLVGGAVAIVAFGFATWRARSRPGSASTAERVVAGAGDERDAAVFTRSLSVGGLLAIPMISVAAIALAAGAGTEATMAILLWAQMLAVVISFVVINRRS